MLQPLLGSRSRAKRFRYRWLGRCWNHDRVEEPVARYRVLGCTRLSRWLVTCQRNRVFPYRSASSLVSRLRIGRFIEIKRRMRIMNAYLSVNRRFPSIRAGSYALYHGLPPPDLPDRRFVAFLETPRRNSPRFSSSSGHS